MCFFWLSFFGFRVTEELTAITEALNPPPDEQEEPQAIAQDNDSEPMDPRLKDAVVYIPAGSDEKSAATIRKWQEQAKLFVLQSVQLFVEPKDESDVVSVLQAAHTNLDIPGPIVEGLSRTYDLAVYDIKCSGESVTHPHLRIMSFRSEHYAKLVRGFVRSLLPQENNIIGKENYPPSALVLTLDGGKHQGAHTVCTPHLLGMFVYMHVHVRLDRPHS